MKARREPLALEVVHADEPADGRAFLRLYVGALLAELRSEPVDEIVKEEPGNETISIGYERECPRIGLLEFLSA